MSMGHAGVSTALSALGAMVFAVLPASAAENATPGPEVADAAEPVAEATAEAVAPSKPLDFLNWKYATGNWGGARDDLKEIGVDFTLPYQQQFQQNFSGGLDTHNAHRNSGSYDAILKLDFEKMNLIPNAGFYLKAKGNWSESDFAGINDDKVGASGAARVNSDAQVDDAIYIKKWWYWHRFWDDKIEARFGRLETNKDLVDVSLYANHEDQDFLSRLSIRNSTIPHQTGIGAFVRVEPVDWFYAQAAAVDAQADSNACNRNIETAFHDEAWYLGFWEFGFTPAWDSAKGPMPGRYRAGLWYDPNPREYFGQDLEEGQQPSARGDNVGFYFGFDQMLWKEQDEPKDSQGLGFFARYGHAHRDVTTISDHWQTGLSYTGLVPTRDKDVTGFSVAQAIRSTDYRHNENPLADRETVYEWYYKIYVTPWLIVSPDLQVVTNPGGDKDDRDALVGGVRFQILF